MTIVIGFILGMVQLMLRAFVIKTLWLWFIVLQFGLAPLSYGTAMGISLFFSIVIGRNFLSRSQIEEAKLNPNDMEVISFNCLIQIIMLLSTLVFSWVIHSFM